VCHIGKAEEDEKDREAKEKKNQSSHNTRVRLKHDALCLPEMLGGFRKDAQIFGFCWYRKSRY